MGNSRNGRISRLLKILSILTPDDLKYIESKLYTLKSKTAKSYLKSLIEAQRNGLDLKIVEDEYIAKENISLSTLKHLRVDLEKFIEDILDYKYFGNNPTYRLVKRWRLQYVYNHVTSEPIFVRTGDANWDDHTFWFNELSAWRAEVLIYLLSSFQPKILNIDNAINCIYSNFALEVLVIISEYVEEVLSDGYPLSWEDIDINVLKVLFYNLEEHVNKIHHSKSGKALVFLSHIVQICNNIFYLEDSRNIITKLLRYYQEIFDIENKCNNCFIITARTLNMLLRTAIRLVLDLHHEADQSLYNIIYWVLDKVKGTQIEEVYKWQPLLENALYISIRNGYDSVVKDIIELMGNIGLKKFMSELGFIANLWLISIHNKKREEIYKYHNRLLELLEKHKQNDAKFLKYLIKIITSIELNDQNLFAKSAFSYYHWAWRVKRTERIASLFRNMAYYPYLFQSKRVWKDLYAKVRILYHNMPPLISIEYMIPFLGWIYSRATGLPLLEAISAIEPLDYRKIAKTSRQRLSIKTLKESGLEPEELGKIIESILSKMPKNS